jgi:hypothetical protein
MARSQYLVIAVVDGPRDAFGEGAFLRCLLESASGKPVRFAKQREARDLEVGSYIGSSVRSLAHGLDSLASRRLGRRVTRFADLSGIGPRPRFSVHTPRLWFTAENVRPPVGQWDLTLSFDTDSLGGQNVYCPLWWADVSVLPGTRSPSAGRLGFSMTADSLLQPRKMHQAPPHFACAFINNPEDMRLYAIRRLSEIGIVDVFGRLSGVPAVHKADVARNYRYVLCFENDVYPGYVTEKPFEAWAAGSVPLWRGLDPEDYLNGAALINAAEPGGIDRMVGKVIELEASSDLYRAHFEQPILNRVPSLSPVVDAIAALLE